MNDLRLPQKMLNDYFELLDYQRDFLALKDSIDKMQEKLAKIKILTSDPESVDEIINDESSSLITTYSSERIEALFSDLTRDAVIAKEKIVTAINARKPSANARIEDSWDLLSFYISLMGNLQFQFKELVLNKVRFTNQSNSLIRTALNDYIGEQLNPFLYRPYEYKLVVSKDNANYIREYDVKKNMSMGLSIFMNSIRVY
ncbi:hypothetical protein [Clostridium polynesiense]|uniref:hypothetical protein n=1 Tax=Clostridium polynesiense TaxID=1325933 RepID=UPI00058E65FB|nr:hypothetical protein [Clostridium polynesiense]